jgi:hypothetical protein
MSGTARSSTITMQIEFRRPDGSIASFERVAAATGTPAPHGEKALVSELGTYLQAELRVDSHMATIPRSDGLANPAKRTVAPLSPTDIHDLLNADGLWLEIQNTLYNANHSLARAKAYQELEPLGDIEEWYPVHAQKLTFLNASVLSLSKIQDLVVRLLFEALGGVQLIPVDYSDDDWEKALTLKNAKAGLKALSDRGSLDPEECATILDALNVPSRCPHQRLVIRYRNAVVHRIRPAVDHAELSPLLQDRKGQALHDNAGKRIGTSYAIIGAAKPEYAFDELHVALRSYIGFVVAMLEQLKSLPRFA